MAERKRATGFVLMDAAFTADAKFVRLARGANPHDFAAAVGVFWLLLADCRRAKSPEIPWDEYEEYASEIAMLKTARLLKEDGFNDESFQRWAPAYRSVSERTRSEGHPEHGAYPSVPNGIPNTVVSGQVSSGQVKSNGVGGVGEGAESFMGWKQRPSLSEPSVLVHDGRHRDADRCRVCHPQPDPRPGVDA